MNRYIIVVANTAERAKVIARLPNAAGIVYRTDAAALEIYDPATGSWASFPLDTSAVTGGTVSASLPVVVDASKDIAGFHDIGFTGTVEAATIATQTKSADYTMTKADSGHLTKVDTDAVVITLPATAPGLFYLFENAGADAAVGFSVSPNASDKFQGVGLTAADNKDLVNTKATAKKGDRLAIVGDGADGWYVVRMTGTWARET